MAQNKLTRIGVFYDGNYFLHVSNYYNYVHPRKQRLSIAGLHEFIRHQIASEEGQDVRLCQVVDSHYFRGRLNAKEASQRGNLLYFDRVFDDILMSQGVITHYLPIKNRNGRKEEKGVDVWMALEAYELAIHKNFDVLVLIASDGDFVPLIRKINTLGTRVMVLSWDFEYTDDNGRECVTRTSQDLLEEVTYPVVMHELIDNRIRKNDMLINNLFVKNDRTFDEPYINGNANGNGSTNGTSNGYDASDEGDGEMHQSTTIHLKDGYGFIAYPPNNLYFHYSDVDGDFNELIVGDTVEFSIARNERGQDVARNVKKIMIGIDV